MLKPLNKHFAPKSVMPEKVIQFGEGNFLRAFVDWIIWNMDQKEAMEEILRYLDRNHLSTLQTSTQIIIAPGYDYKIVKMLVTNFHQPQSTLLLLVSAFVKGDWRKIYDFALSHDFRFLSYGDSSLLIP